ncbi:MAG: hypothetical protein QM778_06505 [Myxococcales bacterium]
MGKRCWLGAVVCLALAGSSAEAQDTAGGVTTPEGAYYPEEPGGYGASAYRAQTAPKENPYHLSMQQKYPFKADVNFEVPVPLTDEHNSADVGFGLSGMFGWDLGFLLPTANVGWAWNGLNLPSTYGDNRSLTRFHMGIGLMAEFENRSVVTPVLGAMLDLNWWHVSGDVSVGCGGYYYWACYQVNNYDYTTGFTFRAGADFGFKRNDRFTLGAGVMPSLTLKGGPFRETEWWLSPYFAFSVRR